MKLNEKSFENYFELMIIGNYRTCKTRKTRKTEKLEKIKLKNKKIKINLKEK